MLDFLLKQSDADANVTICPRCSAVFDKVAAKAFEDEKKAKVKKEKRRIEQERQEVEKKLAEKEAEVAQLRKDIASGSRLLLIKENWDPIYWKHARA